MNRAATKSLQFKFKVVSVKDASGDCIIEGYANTSTKDRVGDVVLPEAFEKCLPTYQKNPVILLNHDWNDVIGRCVSQEITDKGLFIKAKISNTRADIKTLIQEGCYSTFSIGYNELDADYDESTKTKFIKELELLEISVVSVPANTEAMFTQITEKTETEDSEKKTDEEKKSAKSAGSLKSFISEIKTAVGKGFDEESLFAVIDYFNQEETMETKELIKLLRTKSLPEAAAPKDEKAPADDSAKPAADDAGAQDPMKALGAKLDALAQAMAQVMERLDQMGKEEASEDQEDASEDSAEDAEKADDAEKDPSKEDAAKEDDKEKAPAKDEMDKEEEEKDLDLAQVDKDLADLTDQINTLDEEING